MRIWSTTYGRTNCTICWTPKKHFYRRYSYQLPVSCHLLLCFEWEMSHLCLHVWIHGLWRLVLSGDIVEPLECGAVLEVNPFEMWARCSHPPPATDSPIAMPSPPWLTTPLKLWDNTFPPKLPPVRYFVIVITRVRNASLLDNIKESWAWLHTFVTSAVGRQEDGELEARVKSRSAWHTWQSPVAQISKWFNK